MQNKFYALSLSLCLLGSMSFMPASRAETTDTDTVNVDTVYTDTRNLSQNPLVVLDQVTLDRLAAALATYHEVDDSFNDAMRLAWTSGAYAQLPANFYGISDIRTSQNITTQVNPDLNDTEIITGSLSAPALYSALNTTSQRFINTLTGNGPVALDTDGSLVIDTHRLMNNVKWRIWSDPEFQRIERIKIDQVDNTLTPVTSTQLTRLGSRNLNGFAGILNPVTLADRVGSGIRSLATTFRSVVESGTVDANDIDTGTGLTNVYATRFTTDGGFRNIVIVPETGVSDQTGLNMLIQEQGNGFTRTAYRVSSPMLDGTQHLTTYSVTDLGNGAQLEIGEERFVNSVGNGTGTGAFMLTSRDGIVTQGALRTLINSDGSLTSYLDLGPNQNLMINEDAHGTARLSQSIQSSDPIWTPLDWNSIVERIRELVR